ncbi:hypothetical protein RA28_09655 [Ruegeria sp. ANG-S4]|uniref:hypothetical protein n=1 Tax=Ruegeria sp. ANG-S4 TaxID=1577904 RepID=UPI00057CF9F6|nr:hypothetical protein [Ruegeria sp. ANG-S4]KIC45914.1 hypothetical protein RA28_09655 [Ruegeria sp. ANG-S4]
MFSKSVVFLRFHGTFVIILGCAMSIAATIGHLKAAGPLAVLGQDVAGYVGLMQAYILIAVIGLSMWGATMRTRSLRLWHLCGVLAHLPAFVLTLMFWNWMVDNGIPTAAIYMHGSFIVAETCFFFFGQIPIKGERRMATDPR